MLRLLKLGSTVADALLLPADKVTLTVAEISLPNMLNL
jgi:hypothetical protein